MKLRLKTVSGISIKSTDKIGCMVCVVDSFSSDIGKLLRKKLVSICEGEYKSLTKGKIYTYKATVRDFMQRYDSKNENMKKGMIGELLSHLFILECIDDIRASTPLFNLEEKSFTKGFDIIYLHTESKEILLTEVKSGSPNTVQTSTEKTTELLMAANKDIKKKLNSQNDNLWKNAINKLTVNGSNLRRTVEEILETNFIEASDGHHSSIKDNIILTSVLYNQTSEAIDFNIICNYYNSLLKSGGFKTVVLFVIHKNTYSKIEEFLRAEVDNA